MNTYRKNAITAGILFILGTVPAILSTPFIGAVNNDPGFLINISANGNLILIGALILFIAAAACAGIAISLYPVLKKYNEGLALGSVVFRIIEGVLQIAGVISMIYLLLLSQEFVKAGAPDQSYFQTIGVILLDGRAWVRDVLVLLTFSTGALIYYFIFYQTKLIPRWLSVWGLVAIALTIVASILVMFQLIRPFSLIQIVMNIAIFFQEMVFAAWLIVKGFNPSAIAKLDAG